MSAPQIREEQLTAFVMGELHGDELKAVEDAISRSPELKREAETIRAFCGTLWDELSAEPKAELDLGRQRAIRQQTKGVGAPKATKNWWTLAVPGLAVAACATFLVYPRIKNQDVMPHPPKPKATKVESGNDAAEVKFVPAVAEPAAEKKADLKEATRTKDDAAQAEAPMQQQANKPSGVNLNKLGLGVGKVASPSATSSGSPLYRLAGPSGIRGKASGGGAYGIAGNAAPRKSKKMMPSDGFVGRLDVDSEADESGEFNTEAYDRIEDNPFKLASQDPLSTFSADVDTASYANVRRFVTSGQKPPKDSVRIEELVNYFKYDYPEPTDRPFSVSVEVSEAPWSGNRLVRIGMRAKDIEWGKTPPSNLVFLIDVSGSMEDPAKLPLVRQSVKLMLDKLGSNDRVAITVYAGNAGMVLPSTPANEKQKIMDALDRLQAGGSTNGGEGIKLAYKIAEENKISGGVNRVILATDGDFNVGVSSQGDLIRMVEGEAKKGVFLSVLGFGMGNYKDSTLEKLADKGNGNYAYIDTINEARKALVEEIGGTLLTVAKDVKLQIEFNPEQVEGYRLIGYENRILAHEDFNNDAKDAGDIGAGHVVTAFYEVVPKGGKMNVPGVDPLKYSAPKTNAKASGTGEMLTVKLRYKAPEASKSSLIEYAVKDTGKKIEDASSDFKFAAGVASFGMLLRDSEHKGTSSYEKVLELSGENLGDDKTGYRKEFVELVRKAQKLK